MTRKQSDKPSPLQKLRCAVYTRKSTEEGLEMEFNSLDAKVAQFVGLCERLRAENHDLRQQLASARNDAKRLNERIEGAKVKLENLLARLPD